MARGKKIPSKIFKKILTEAKDQLSLDANKASVFKHRGIRGDRRAAAIASFFRDHLPERFCVAQGEAMDCHDNQSGQLDILIYDSHASAAITSSDDNVLVPADALIAVIEVKSILTQDELDKCYASASKIRKLRPYKKGRFVSARHDGGNSPKDAYRCLFVVFAYETNLGEGNWLKKEFARLQKAADIHKVDVDFIDLIMVLNRGIIRPDSEKGKIETVNVEETFLDFYLNVINFLNRELPRRQPVDWQIYGSRSSKDWVKTT